jgi:primase-polymerase (primpol)-like protein
VSFDAIPVELRDLERWVVWRWGEVDPKTGKRKKPPYIAANPTRNASSTKAATWGTFEQAVAVVDAGRADGIGFALTQPYVGIDLDDELPASDQGVIMVALDSYSEKSVSGTGYHVIIRAELNGHGRHPVGIGVFQVDRFFYFTGQHVHGTPTTIEGRQAELEEGAGEVPAGAAEHHPG